MWRRHFGLPDATGKARRYWRIPVMDGEFLVEETAGVAKGIGGGNFIVQCRSLEAALAAARRAVASIDAMTEEGGVENADRIGREDRATREAREHPFLVRTQIGRPAGGDLGTNPGTQPGDGQQGSGQQGNEALAALPTIDSFLTAPSDRFLVDFDATRLPRVRDAIAALAARHQVLFLTFHEDGLGLPGKRIVLPRG